MRARAWCGLVLSLGVLLTGCPDSTSGAGSVPIAALPHEVAQTYCRVIFDCGVTENDLAATRLVAGSVDACTRFLEPGFQRELTENLRWVDAGRVRYDGAAARQCLLQLERTCAALDDGGPPCNAVFLGTVPIGGGCDDSDECAGDAYCNHDMASGDCGVCAARAAIGAPCDLALCTRSVASQCDYSGSTPTCVEVRSAPPAGAGAVCGRATSGGVVTATACAAGLYCQEPPEGDAGTCAPLPAADGPCTQDGVLCEGDQLCVDGRCRAITIQRTEGAPCGEAMLALCDPLSRLSCESGTCARLGDGTAGSPCSGNGAFEGLPCNAGLVCSSDLCVAPQPEGGPCETDRECASGRCGDPDGDGTESCQPAILCP